MSIRNTYHLDGSITLRSPLAILQPGTEGDAFKAQPVPSMPIFYEGIGLATTAYLPASTIRGALRRAAVVAVANERERQGLPHVHDLRSFYMLMVGGTRSRGGDNRMFDASIEQRVRDRNVLISVFGAADTGDAFFISGRLAVNHARPAAPLSPESCPVFTGVRSDDLLRAPSRVSSLLSPSAVDAWTELHSATIDAARKKKQKKSLGAELNKARRAGDQEALDNLSAQLKQIDMELSEAVVSIQLPLAGYRALPEGLELEHRMTLRNATQSELGMLLAALKVFAADPVLGGHRAHGCGEVACRWHVMQKDAEGHRHTLGEVEIDQTGLHTAGSPWMELPLSAWSAECTKDFRFQPISGNSTDDRDA